jgi:hypothetical protein
MKKLIFILLGITVCTLLLYWFIPNHVVIKRSIIVNNNPKGIYRALTNKDEWTKWWPGNYDSNTRQLKWHDNIFEHKGFTSNYILLTIKNPLFNISANMVLVPAQTRMQNIYWVAATPTSYNPVKRVQAYMAAKSLEDDMESILSSIEKYYSDTVNLYGVKIERDFVKDSALIFTYDSVKGYPSSEKIYSLVNDLRNHIKAFSAIATDSPMLNVYTADSVWFFTKVAIPTNRALPSVGKISYKWMLGHGNILTADVQGDSKKVQAAFTGVENYVHDFELASPAIPFCKLITNRLAEKDSTKWNTRIYYPVMYYKD